MRNFDSEWEKRKSEDARSFTICGETFVMKRGIKPEALQMRDDINESSPVGESMAALDELFLSMIEHRDDAEERYRAVRTRDDDALGIRDINEVIDWMIEQATGRPPTSRSDSTHGRERTGTRSTGGSSSQALQEA